ncbi:MAG TPA: hypothetical protein VK424_04920 [Thermoplasmata archaeon]|nr:hypothetical protein [Thermoplasmata archaeon]
MMLPGLIPLAFYERKPTAAQVVLGLASTVVLSAFLGYISPGGPIGRLGLVVLAIVGAVFLYVAIQWYLLYVYYPTHATTSATAPPA